MSQRKLSDFFRSTQESASSDAANARDISLEASGSQAVDDASITPDMPEIGKFLASRIY